jgi:hypothetical protein
LGREFDSVFIHDAIVYMTTTYDLRSAVKTAYVHLKPGGAALFEPDYVRETFKPSTRHGGHDGKDRALRYLEWTYDPDPGASPPPPKKLKTRGQASKLSLFESPALHQSN